MTAPTPDVDDRRQVRLLGWFLAVALASVGAVAVLRGHEDGPAPTVAIDQDGIVYWCEPERDS